MVRSSYNARCQYLGAQSTLMAFHSVRIMVHILRSYESVWHALWTDVDFTMPNPKLVEYTFENVWAFQRAKRMVDIM